KAFIDNLSPDLRPQYEARITAEGNNMRLRALQIDHERKGKYLTDRGIELMNSQALNVANEPHRLEEAKQFLDNYYMSIPDEDLSQDAKAQELAKGHIKLE